MDFEERVLSGLENKFKKGILDSTRRNIYFSRVHKELLIVNKLNAILHYLLAEEVNKSIEKAGINAVWKECIISSSLISFCIGLIKEDPVKIGRVFEIYANPEVVDFEPALILDISEKGKLKLLLELLPKLSESASFEGVECGHRVGQSSQIRISEKILNKKFGFSDKGDYFNMIYLILRHSERLSFLENNPGKKFKMPDLYHKIVAETKGELIYKDQAVLFLSDYLNISLEDAYSLMCRLSVIDVNVYRIFCDFSFLNNIKDTENVKYVIIKISEETRHLRHL